MPGNYYPEPRNNIPSNTVGARQSTRPGYAVPLPGDKPPTQKEIIKAVEDAIKNEIKRIHQDAYLYQHYGLRTTQTIRSYEKKQALTAALELLPTLIDLSHQERTK